MTHFDYTVLLIGNRTTLTINAIGSLSLIVDQSSFIVTQLSLIRPNSYKHVFVYIYWSNDTGQSLRLSTCDYSTSTAHPLLSENLHRPTLHSKCPLHHIVLPFPRCTASAPVYPHPVSCASSSTTRYHPLDPMLSCSPSASLLVQ